MKPYSIRWHQAKYADARNFRLLLIDKASCALLILPAERLNKFSVLMEYGRVSK